MTKSQLQVHAEIMKELRSRFEKFWLQEAIPAMADSDILMDEKEMVMSMHNCWNTWRRPLVEGNIMWFVDRVPHSEN